MVFLGYAEGTKANRLYDSHVRREGGLGLEQSEHGGS